MNLGDSDASDELPRLGAAAVSEAEEEKLELSPAKARGSSLRATKRESQERSNSLTLSFFLSFLMLSFFLSLRSLRSKAEALLSCGRVVRIARPDRARRAMISFVDEEDVYTKKEIIFS